MYTIGETSSLNQISIKALRHYDKIGLLKPAYIDDQNGYRYYTYEQFSYIDKIKRYKNLGMSLSEIKEFFETQSNQVIEDFLEHQKEIVEENERKLKQLKNNLDYMIEFFKESKILQLDESVSLKHFNKRHVIFSKCIGGSENKDIYMMDLGLRQILATNVPASYPVLNPYGYILDSINLKNGIIRPTHSFVNTTVKNTDTQDWILQLPEGEYLCFKAAIFSEEVNLEPLIEYLQKEKRTPKLIVACEYLKSFYDPIRSPYEIQILL